MRVKGGHSWRNRYVKLVEVHIVAAPRQRLAVGGEDYAGDAIDATGWAVIAWNPFGRDERDWAGGHGQIYLGVEKLARNVRKVNGDLNRRLLALRGRLLALRGRAGGQ